eukprot:sb/3475661/
MFLKTLTIGGTVACSVLLGHYKANCKDANKTDHPARIQFPTRSWDSNWDCMKPDKEALENLTDESLLGRVVGKEEYGPSHCQSIDLTLFSFGLTAITHKPCQANALTTVLARFERNENRVRPML